MVASTPTSITVRYTAEVPVHQIHRVGSVEDTLAIYAFMKGAPPAALRDRNDPYFDSIPLDEPGSGLWDLYPLLVAQADVPQRFADLTQLPGLTVDREDERHDYNEWLRNRADPTGGYTPWYWSIPAHGLVGTTTMPIPDHEPGTYSWDNFVGRLYTRVTISGSLLQWSRAINAFLEDLSEREIPQRYDRVQPEDWIAAHVAAAVAHHLDWRLGELDADTVIDRIRWVLRHPDYQSTEG